MSDKSNPIRQLAREAVDSGAPLEVKTILELRARSKQAINVCKGIFWGGIAICNIALWAPLPVTIDRTLLNVVAVAALIVGIVVPIFGQRKHQLNLELLKVNKQGLNKKTTSEAGRRYIELVKKQDRSFINAEFEILEDSKWADGAEEK